MWNYEKRVGKVLYPCCMSGVCLLHTLHLYNIYMQHWHNIYKYNHYPTLLHHFHICETSIIHFEQIAIHSMENCCLTWLIGKISDRNANSSVCSTICERIYFHIQFLIKRKCVFLQLEVLPCTWIIINKNWSLELHKRKYKEVLVTLNHLLRSVIIILQN